MNDVFISYSRRDKVFTQKLFEALKAVNRDVWADWDDIPASSDWFAEIKQGIEETDSVIFVLSPEWIKSRECRKEMDYAVQMGKRLFPILYIPIDPKDVPPELAKINWVYMRDTDDFEKGFQTLYSAMDTDLDWIKTHTRIQVRALEWEKKNRSASFALRGEDLTEGEQFLANGATKIPVPTPLQSEYILASRKDATRRQRQTLAGVTVALVVSIVLAITAIIQRQTAVTNEKEAKKQAQIALSRQLAAQAQSFYAGRSSNQMVAVLLSIQSIRLFPSTEAANFLINNNFAAHQIKLLQHDVPVEHIAVSPDGKYVAGAGRCLKIILPANCNIIIWEVSSGKKVTLLTHDDGVNSTVFSPDGNYVLSGSSDKTARVWKVENGEEVFRIFHESDVTAIAFSPDSKYVVSGDREGHVRVWEVADKMEVLHVILSGESPDASSVAFSPDSKYVAAARTCDEYRSSLICALGFARVWEVASKKEIAQMNHDGAISLVTFSPDGKYLLSGNLDSTASLWSISGEEVARFNTSGPVDDTVVFSPDGKYILVDSDNMAQVWDIASKKEVSHITHDGPIFSLAFSPDGKLVLSGSEDGTARIWNASNGEEIARMTHDDGDLFSSVYSVAFSPDGKYAFSGGADKTIRVWETTSFDNAVVMDNHKSGNEVLLSPHGKYLFLRINENTYCVWEAASGRQVNCTNGEMAYPLTFSPDENKLLLGGLDSVLRIWDIASGNEVIIKDQSLHATFSPDSKLVGTVSHPICVWDAASGAQVRCISLSLDSTLDSLDYVRSVAFSLDGKYILTGSAHGWVCMWESSSGKKVTCATQSNSVDALEFSPDGKNVFFGDGTENACTWDVASSKHTTCMHLNHDGFTQSYKFSSDGQYVASASWDRIARVWETATGTEIARKIHESEVFSVVFSLDGKYMLSATRSGIVRRWLWQQDDLLADACERLTRNLTRAEWEQFIGDAMPYPTKQEDATCPNLPLEPELTPTPTVTP